VKLSGPPDTTDRRHDRMLAIFHFHLDGHIMTGRP
jgi:hypothetical protein